MLTTEFSYRSKRLAHRIVRRHECRENCPELTDSEGRQRMRASGYDTGNLHTEKANEFRSYRFDNATFIFANPHEIALSINQTYG